MYIGLLKFLVMFFCENLSKPCRHATTFQMVSQQSLASIMNKKPQNSNKMAACSHHCPLWHEHRLGALVYHGIPSDQARAILPPSWALLPDDNRQPIEFLIGVPNFNSTEKVLISTIYEYIFSDYGKKGVIFDEIYPFGS